MEYFKTDGFMLYLYDSFELLKSIEEKSIDMIFADPSYFLSNNGISCHSGKMISVNKANWDKNEYSPEEKLEYNRK
jgi:site-specific DNA-methyltransferase (adenine-specific)